MKPDIPIPELGTPTQDAPKSAKPPMIGMDLVREMCHIVLLTGKIKGHSPLSLLLIADPEHGKTSVVLEGTCPATVDITDATGRGIVEILKYKPEVSHLIFNDFTAVSAHGKTVRAYTIAMINAMTEEGIRAIAFPGQVDTFTEKQGKRGIIACLTLDLLKDGRAWFNKIGLTSRMIPFAFTHSKYLKMAVKKAIDTDYRNVKINGKGRMSIPSIAIEVPIPSDMTERIRAISDEKTKELGDPTGYRRLKQFRNLTRAHAISRTWKKPCVNQDDVAFLAKIMPYVSYELCKELPWE